jgi:serine protease DegS
MGKSLIFILKSVVAGLAAAFVIVWFRPDWVLSPDARSPTGTDLLTLMPDAIADTAPAVVNIYTTRAVDAGISGGSRQRLGLGYGSTSRRLVTSLGSGVIISPSGALITNNHVIANARDIKVQLADGRVAEPLIIGTDADTDLALLHIQLEDLPSMTLGRSDNLRTGELVLAIGNPYGLSQTVTQGIVSATGRTQLGLTRFENYIQTDAAINIGNSGGALVNLRGELIGINTATVGGQFSADGIGFAIPVNLVRGVARQLQEHGRVRRGWLGFVPRDLTEPRAKQLNLDAMGGVELVHIYPDSPALRAGLMTGDIITHINDQRVQVSRQALNIVAAMMPDDAAEIIVIRNGNRLTINATTSEQPFE